MVVTILLSPLCPGKPASRPGRCAVAGAAGRGRAAQALGFREVGIYEKHGCLDGGWRDVVIVERLIPANLKS
jgi:hypothetical protein